jgi:hypothetical protein
VFVADYHAVLSTFNIQKERRNPAGLGGAERLN